MVPARVAVAQAERSVKRRAIGWIVVQHTGRRVRVLAQRSRPTRKEAVDDALRALNVFVALDDVMRFWRREAALYNLQLWKVYAVRQPGHIYS
jgi:hypothetical protein